jgi:phosphotriesterase-related protein
VPQVETTAGPIDADQLGRTLIHEHLLTASEAVRAQFPHLYDPEDERRRALEAIRSVQAHGVRTWVDPACMDLARDAAFSRDVAAEADIQMVMCTGVYGQHYTFLPHHFQSRDEDYLADAFVHDIEEGIQGTEVKAAFIKCAADEPGVTPDVEKVHRAAARASQRTGRPIMAHSRPASRTGLDQMRIFSEEGVDPHRIQLAHTGDTDDLDHIETLIDTGAWIGLDRFGIDLFLPDDRRIRAFVELCARGYADRIMLGCDACATLDWFPEGAGGPVRADVDLGPPVRGHPAGGAHRRRDRRADRHDAGREPQGVAHGVVGRVSRRAARAPRR